MQNRWIFHAEQCLGQKHRSDGAVRHMIVSWMNFLKQSHHTSLASTISGVLTEKHELNKSKSHFKLASINKSASYK